jgi:hypothetical protein
MGSKSTPSVSPDYTPIAQSDEQASQLQYQLGQQQLAYAKNLSSQELATAAPVVASDLQTQQQEQQIAQQQENTYNSTYLPIEKQFASQATNYDNADNANQQAGAAEANVASQFDASRASAQSSLESYGIDPSQTRFGALDLGTQVQQAAATAAAGTTSRLQTQATGLSLESAAINTGRGYSQSVNSAYSGAVGAGSSGVGASNSTGSTAVSEQGGPSTYFGLSQGSNSGAVGALNTGFNNQLGADQLGYQEEQGTINDIGGLVGAGTSYFAPNGFSGF